MKTKVFPDITFVIYFNFEFLDHSRIKTRIQTSSYMHAKKSLNISSSLTNDV